MRCGSPHRTYVLQFLLCTKFRSIYIPLKWALTYSFCEMAFNLFPRDFLELQQFQDKSTPLWTLLPQVFRWACWQQVGEFLCLSGTNLIRNIHSTWSCFYDINNVGLVIAFVFCNVMRSVKNRDTEDVNNKWLIECGRLTYTVLISFPSFFPLPFSVSPKPSSPSLCTRLSVHPRPFVLSCQSREKSGSKLRQRFWTIKNDESCVTTEGGRERRARFYSFCVSHTCLYFCLPISWINFREKDRFWVGQIESEGRRVGEGRERL